MPTQDRDPQNQRKRYPTREPERSADPVRRYPRPESAPQPPEQKTDSVRRHPRPEHSSYASTDQERTDSRASRSPSANQESSRSTQRPNRQQTPYSNPPVNHQVNVTQQSEVAIFFKLLAKIAFAIVFLFLFIYFCFRLLTPYIPYSFEENISQNFIGAIIPEEINEYEPARKELQTLAENLAKHMNA
ncbi:MAG: hypothetical protein ACRCWR_11325, partial [Saezia sp.]